MALDEMSQEELARLLAEAERAHAAYEREHIEGRDSNWPSWYAGYILQRVHREHSEE